MTTAEIAAEIQRHRFSYAHEKDLQDGIASLFGDRLSREFHLGAFDRPDFFIEADGVVIEIKVKGSAGSVLLQLERYAKHDRVKGLVLVTTRSTQALRMPYILNEKPLHVVCLRQL
jgi:hypothetical protein